MPSESMIHMMALLGAILEWTTQHPLASACALAGGGLFLAACQFGDRWRLRHVPGRWGRFIVGDAPDIATEDFTFFVDRMYRKYTTGKLFKFWLGPFPIVAVRDVDLAKRVLHKYAKRSSLDMLGFKTGLDRKIWSSILVSLWGAKWRLGRRATEASIMHPKALLAQAPSVARCTKRLVDRLDRYASTGEPFDVQVCTYAMAMDAIGWATFGVDLHASSASQEGHANADAVAPVSASKAGGADKAGESGEWWLEHPVGSPEFGQRLVECAITTMRALEMPRATIYTTFGLLFPRFHPLLSLLSHVLPGERLKTERKAMKGLTEACKVMMDSWKQRTLAIKAGQAETASAISDQGFLARLLSGEDFAPDDTLEDFEATGLAISNVVAGYDTTGTTIAMSLHFLAHNPDAQARAQREVDTVLQGKDVQLDDLDSLPFANAVLLESMRLASPAAGAVREVVEEPFDVGDGKVLPVGSFIFVPLYSYHRDPSLWPRPLEFLPERHMQPGNEDLAPATPNAFMPFGAGPRMCVGYKFASLEVCMTIARLMQHFTFEPVPGAPAPAARTGITFSPNKVLLHVRKRSEKK